MRKHRFENLMSQKPNLLMSDLAVFKQESTITVVTENEIDFISLTDMTASFNEGSGLIGKWITNKNTLEYLGF